ncbi:TPA: hypothetical protein QB624_000399 [Pasteurella multocida]|nr:hypothetical protein [Pasteurella multocida]
MKLTFDKWGGSAPRLDPRATPADYAVKAKNTRPDPFSLKPWARARNTNQSVKPTARTIYRYTDQHWFQWDTDVSVVPAPIANDPNHEVIFCDHEGVKFTRNSIALSASPYPTASRFVGMAQPDTPIAANRGSTPNGDDIETVDIAYVVTFVDDLGREGPASKASGIVTVDSKDIQIEVKRPALPTGRYALTTGARWRIYRTNTASDGSGVFQYVTEQAIETEQYLDKTAPDELLEVLTTNDWFAPPDTNLALWPSGPLKGLINVANSFLAGFTGRTLCFSVPGVPHAWPPAYQIVVEYDIVAIASVGSDIVVLTKGHPYIVTGSSPGNLSALKLPDPQSCISARSVVAFEDSVVYASPDGLCMISGTRSNLISADTFDERNWAEINPATLVAGYYEGVYIGHTDNTSFVFIPKGGPDQYREINFTPKAMYNDLSTDTLYYHEGDGVIKEFNKGDGYHNYEWESGVIRLPRKVNFGWASVYASDYPVTFKLITQSDCNHRREEIYTANCSSPIRLKGGYLANEFTLSITSDKVVHSIEFANRLQELSQ